MIKSFADKETEELFQRQPVKKLPFAILRTAYRKLLLIDGAEALSDLRMPPGNRLEKLSGPLAGRFSIRINDRWRVVSSWTEGNAYDVEITDYHGK